MLELDVFLHSWSDFPVSVINANRIFQLNKITFIGVSLFQPNSFPLLVSKEKKLLNLSAHHGQVDKKICQLRKRICHHGANKNFQFKSREQVGINYAVYTRRKRDVKDKFKWKMNTDRKSLYKPSPYD